MPQILKRSNILVINGDVSGDFHSANLISEIKKIAPSINVYAIGGVRTKEVCDRFLYDVVSKGVFGFVSSIKSFPLWVALISLVRRFLEEKKPAFVITVDFFGFNRQVLGLCRNRKIPVYYYIPPQVWASRPKRAITVAQNSKRIYAIFPFEVDIYKKLNADVRYFGHPLIDSIGHVDISMRLKFDPSVRLNLGILPGSRKSEIERHLPVFVEVFRMLKRDFRNLKGYVFMVDEFDEKYYRDIIGFGDENLFFIRDKNYEERKKMDFCLTCSGTATLENAFLGIPMIVGYKTNFFNYEIARALIKTPYISLPNIVLSRQLIKEFIQYSFTPQPIYRYVKDLLTDRNGYEKIVRDMYEVRKYLDGESVVKKIAMDIMSDFEIL